jgi:hypothetical protein
MSARLALVLLVALAAAGCDRCGGARRQRLTIPDGPKVAGPACTAKAAPICADPDCDALLRCPGMAVLWGQAVDASSERYPFPGFARAEVSAWPAGREAEATRGRADGSGNFAFLVPAGAPVFYQAAAEGRFAELHAAEVPPEGWLMDLDLRTPATLREIFAKPPGRAFDANKGIVAIEITGASGRGGEGATLEPAGDPPFVLDAPFEKRPRLVDSNVLVPGGEKLVIFPNVAPGAVRVRWLAPPGVTCAAQAASVREWPVRANTVTQIDAICRR